MILFSYGLCLRKLKISRTAFCHGQHFQYLKYPHTKIGTVNKQFPFPSYVKTNYN